MVLSDNRQAGRVTGNGVLAQEEASKSTEARQAGGMGPRMRMRWAEGG